MTDYQQGKIYKIISDNTNAVYVGSTVQTLSQRLATHVSHNKSHKLGLLNNCKSFDIIDLDNYMIVLIEPYPCNSKEELKARERHWIESTPNCNNKNIPTRTHKEYYQDNKAKIIVQNAEYIKLHPEVRKKAKDNYKANHPDRVKQQAKEQNAKQWEKNKDKLIENQRLYNASEHGKAKIKEYYAKNIELIKQKRQEKVLCECGEQVPKHSHARHCKSQRHIDAVKNQP